MLDVSNRPTLKLYSTILTKQIFIYIIPEQRLYVALYDQENRSFYYLGKDIMEIILISKHHTIPAVPEYHESNT